MSRAPRTSAVVWDLTKGPACTLRLTGPAREIRFQSERRTRSPSLESTLVQPGASARQLSSVREMPFGSPVVPPDDIAWAFLCEFDRTFSMAACQATRSMATDPMIAVALFTERSNFRASIVPRSSFTAASTLRD
jgi:hypothetical protein